MKFAPEYEDIAEIFSVKKNPIALAKVDITQNPGLQ
jgi:hypothetical protein